MANPSVSGWPSEGILAASYRQRLEAIRPTKSGWFLAGRGTFIFGDRTWSAPDLIPRLRLLPADSRVVVILYGDVLGTLLEYARHPNVWRRHRVKFVSGAQSHARVLAACVSDAASTGYWPFTLPQAPSLPRSTSGASAGPRFGYVGRISWWKHVHHLVELFTDYSLRRPGHELHLWGPIDNHSWPREKRVHAFGLAGEMLALALERARLAHAQVHYHGLLSPEDVCTAIAGLDVYTTLSTSPAEDFGVSVAQALALEVPCVLSRWGGHREFEDLPEVTTVPVRMMDGPVLDREQLFLAWDNAHLRKVTRAFTSWDSQRRMQEFPDLEKDWPRFAGFSDGLHSIMDAPREGKEFYDYGCTILSPLWE
jgi:hypothetical protein